MPIFAIPKLLKGALVSLNPPDPTPSVVIFQYNPNTLTRSLEAQMQENEGKTADPPRFKGAPVETVKLDVEIDAADQLEKNDATARDAGILPQLAALEILLYPSSKTVQSNKSQLQAGTLEVMPAAAPLTLFIWGKRRILPVRLTEFSVTEDAHNPNLSPVRAKVSLGLRVLSYSDVGAESPIWSLFLSHQKLKESLAAVATTGSLNAVMGSEVKLI